ncbi:transcriptional regulator [Rhodococcus opacus PD630]|uniref:cupin domain-containing protein n=1 Tax=Rhodococcus opacus TaxID=37919 RepID=UPI00029CB572|nr:transcriptional regulator [Rhodococcus opacus]AHK34175.1 putative thc operon regulatory protein [Rhodococcus opacus PD630]EHI39910.1 transcriptional regulator [Rhodococcus opacus PD630]UDG96370.1 transcriptional regulator [Rhodococcus opacus PD630]
MVRKVVVTVITTVQIAPEGKAALPFDRLEPVHLATAGTIGLYYFDYGTDARMNPNDPGDFYVVQIPLSGTARITSGAEEFDSTMSVASILQPGRPATMQWHEGQTQLIIRLARRSLEEHLQEILGTPLSEPLRFETRMELESPAVRGWREAVELLEHEVANHASITADSAAMEEFDLIVLSQFLSAQPNNYSARLRNLAQSLT